MQARTTAKPAAATPGAAVPGAAAPNAGLSREDAVKISPRVAIETPSLRGSISLRGGRFDDIVLVKYHITVDPKSGNVVLFSPSDSPHPYFAEYGWVPAAGSNVKVPDRDTLWQGGGAVDAGDPGHPHVGQRTERHLQAHRLGRRQLHVQDRRRGREPHGCGDRAGALCARASLRHAEDREQLDPARRPDRRHRRPGRAA